MKKTIVVMLAVAMVISFVVLAIGQNADKKAESKFDSAPTELNWLKYDKALETAEQEQKHVLVYFTTSWCTFCKKMKKTTFKDPEVIRLMNSGFVLAKVDGDSREKVKVTNTDGEVLEISERDLTRSYKVTGYPTMIFLKPDGTSLAPLPGYQKASTFKHALEFISTSAYEEMDYNEFVSKKG